MVWDYSITGGNAQTLKGVLCGRLSYLRESCVADSNIEGSLVW